MSYIAEHIDDNGWAVHIKESGEYLATDLAKMSAIKLVHFLNGGSLVEWSEIYAILSDSENLE